MILLRNAVCKNVSIDLEPHQENDTFPYPIAVENEIVFKCEMPDSSMQTTLECIAAFTSSSSGTVDLVQNDIVVRTYQLYLNGGGFSVEFNAIKDLLDFSVPIILKFNIHNAKLKLMALNFLAFVGLEYISIGNRFDVNEVLMKGTSWNEKLVVKCNLNKPNENSYIIRALTIFDTDWPPSLECIDIYSTDLYRLTLQWCTNLKRLVVPDRTGDQEQDYVIWYKSSINPSGFNSFNYEECEALGWPLVVI